MNPRNDQAALDRQFEEQNGTRYKREQTLEESLALSAYAEASIRRDKSSWPTNGNGVGRSLEFNSHGQLIGAWNK
jgi:hypothetical protein